MRNRQATNLGHHLRSLHLRDMPDGIEDRRLGETVIGHVQQPREIRERPANAERKGERELYFDGISFSKSWSALFITTLFIICKLRL